MYYHLTRQPVFNKAQAVYAYDLLLRARRGTDDLNRASIETLANSSLLTNLKEIANGRKVLVSVSPDVLEGDYVYALPKKTAVIALDESIVPSVASMAACQKLRNAGYQLALRGLGARPERTAFFEFVALVRVDLTSMSEGELDLCCQAAARLPGLQLIAAGLGTRELYARASEFGASFFQGDYFCQPEVLTGRDLQAFKLPFLRMLKEIHHPEVDFLSVESLIKQDVALTYKLLRYVNSAALNRREEVRSIQSALSLLGERELRKWATLVSVSGLTKGKPKELLAKALARARFCESLAPHAGLTRQADELFLLGIFSLLDAILDRPLAAVLAEVPLSDEVKKTLLGEPGPYSAVYDCAVAYEDGRWELAVENSFKFALDEEVLPEIYLSTVHWVNQQLANEALCA